MHTHQDNLKTFALVGTPNSGKTTLYNWLTGSRFKTVNYPGATVEYSVGSLATHLQNTEAQNYKFVDTPGVYSLHPKSADEEVTCQLLFSREARVKVSAVLVVVDGTQLDRHLILAEQVKASGYPMLLVVTMADLLKRQKLQLDLQKLQRHFNCPVQFFDGVMGAGLLEIVSTLASLPGADGLTAPAATNSAEQSRTALQMETLAKSAFAEDEKAVDQKMKNIFASSTRIDKILLHPVLGVVSFLVIMSMLFGSIFWLAAPFMDWIDGAFASLIDSVIALAPESLWSDFVGNGLLGAFASILIFVPQIFILFIGIGILEGTGYLARAATIIDLPLSKLGLSGRSFVPLLSGYACAVPAMIATRNISSQRDRWITNFIIPMMSCSARLPVYSLLVSFLFKNESPFFTGFVFALIYLASAVFGAIAAGILNKIVPLKKDGFFMMELPLYRAPRWKVLFSQSLSRTKSYVMKAGPIIFVFAVIIWVGSTFPRHQDVSPSQQVAQSYLGQAGQVLEPVFKPMGLDWRVGIGLISAFAAREVFVSTMALVFDVTAEDDAGMQEGLLKVMAEAKNSEGDLIFTLGSSLGLIVFFMIAMQCMSTFAVSVRESGSWKFAVTQLVVLNLVAYVLAILLNITLA